MSYEDFLQAKFQATENLSGAEATDLKTTLKEMRAKFAASGGLGSKFRFQQDKMLKQLLLPKGAREELGIVGDTGMEPPKQEEHDT